MSNLAIFGFYLENCKRQVFNVNCEIDQHDKFYLPANVQQNRTTGVGVMAPEMSVLTYSCIFGYYLEIYRRQKVNLNCKFEQHDKVYLPGIGLQVLKLLASEMSVFTDFCIFQLFSMSTYSQTYRVRFAR